MSNSDRHACLLCLFVVDQGPSRMSIILIQCSNVRSIGPFCMQFDLTLLVLDPRSPFTFRLVWFDGFADSSNLRYNILDVVAGLLCLCVQSTV